MARPSKATTKPKSPLPFRFTALYDGSFELPFGDHEINSARQPDNSDLEPWMAYYLKEEVRGVESRHTFRSKRYDLHKFLAFASWDLPAPDITLWDKACTGRFADALVKEYSPETTNRVLATLSNVAKFLVDYEVIPARANPARNIQKRSTKPLPFESIRVIWSDPSCTKKLPVLTSKEKYDLFMSAAEDFTKGPGFDPKTPRLRALPFRDRAIIWLLFTTALRAEELCSLPCDSREGSSRDGVWFDNVPRKGGDTENIYVLEEGKALINAYMERERLKIIEHADRNIRDHRKFLLLSWRGRRLSQPIIWSIVQKIATRASSFLPRGLVFKAHPHSFRHEKGFLLRELGYSDAQIAKLLGHKNLLQVNRYSKGDEGADEALHESIKYPSA